MYSLGIVDRSTNGVTGVSAVVVRPGLYDGESRDRSSMKFPACTFVGDRGKAMLRATEYGWFAASADSSGTKAYGFGPLLCFIRTEDNQPRKSYPNCKWTSRSIPI